MSENEFQNEDDYLNIYLADTGVDLTPEKQARESVYMYVTPVFLIIGTIGNIISAIVLCKMFRKVMTTCLYLFASCFVDLFVLYIHAGNDWVTHFLGQEYNIRVKAMYSSNSLCKIYPFTADFALHLSIWLVVAMTIETAMVSLVPARLLRVCKIERARAAILLITVLLVCVNAHYFWTFSQIKIEKGGQPVQIVCTNEKPGMNHHSENFRKIGWPVINILVSDFLPYFIIFSCTVIMLTKKLRRRENSREIEAIWKAYNLDAVAARQLLVTFISASIAYLLLLLPKLCCDIFHYLVSHDEGLGLVAFSFTLDVKMRLTIAICDVLLYTFLSCKIFIYLATSRKFRQELCSIFSCTCCQRKHHVTSNHNNRTPSSDLVQYNNLNNFNCVHNDVQRRSFSSTTV